MPKRLVKITTASEFGASVGSQDFVLHQWLPSSPATEPDIRHTIDAIFNDLQYIDTGDRAFVAAFLDGITEPLRQRQESFGLQLVVGTTRGKMKLPPVEWKPEPEEIAWERAYYIVAPDPAFFRADDGPIHKLGTSCRDAFVLATDPRDDVPRKVWGSLEDVFLAFEGTPPWCPKCRADAPELLLA
jgi:hypothetical protein